MHLMLLITLVHLFSLVLLLRFVNVFALKNAHEMLGVYNGVVLSTVVNTEHLVIFTVSDFIAELTDV